MNGALEVMNRLRAAGHDVVSASPSDLSETMAAMGVTFVKLDPWVPHPEHACAGTWLSRVLGYRRRRAQAVEQLGTARFAEVMRAQGADLLLIEVEMREHIAAALAAGLRVATLSAFATLWNRPNMPPLHSAVQPGQRAWGSKLGLAVLWRIAGAQNWMRILARRLRTVGLDRHSILRTHARGLGLPFKPNYGAQLFLLPDRRDDLPVLSMIPREFDLPHDRHPAMHYLGPMVAKNRPTPELAPGDAAALQSVFRLCETNRRTLIYCGLSTFFAVAPARIGVLAEVARKRPDWQFVIGLGGGAAARDALDLPPNILALRDAPQLDILQQADCAVLDAGISAIMEALEFQVPMLLFSQGRVDQNGNSARVKYHRLGYVAGPSAQTPDGLQAALEALLRDDGLRDRLSAFAN